MRDDYADASSVHEGERTSGPRRGRGRGYTTGKIKGMLRVYIEEEEGERSGMG